MANEAQNPESSTAPKGLPVKTLLILLAVLVIEGAAISAVFLMAGGPSDVRAEGTAVDDAALAEQPVELPVVSGKFPNTKRGRTYIYDTEVFIVVRHKDQEKIQGQLETMSAQVSADIRTIISRAEPNHLLEPTLATLKRQVQATLDQRFGRDEEGQSYIKSVVITKFTQFRADG